jgi:lambda family phage portal protein
MDRTFHFPGQRAPVTVRENFIDKAIGYIAPSLYRNRLRSRIALAATDSYFGASPSRRQTLSWQPESMDADSHTTFALPALRSRAADLVRNSPLAGGAIDTVLLNAHGTGLRLMPRIDRAILNMSDEAADAWEATTQAEWSLFFNSRDVDASRILRGPQLAGLAFRGTLERGDIFVNMPRINRLSNPYTLSLQLIEADRVSNPGYKPDSEDDTGALVAGVKKNALGEHIGYWVANRHPLSRVSIRPMAWEYIAAYGQESLQPNILHLFEQLRPGQTRGLPYLAPVIETFKMLDRYTEAELMAAVVAAMFTVFIKTESDFGLPGPSPLSPMQPTMETGATTADKDFKMAPAAILAMRPNESIETANPQRPNTAFDPFVLAILRQVGVRLGLPYEVLIKHFTSSYSAARAALLDAWKFFTARREWLAGAFYQPIYEAFLYEAIALDRISAPGFFADPLIHLAYCGAQWTGPARGMIDETKEVQAARDRIDGGISTMQEETAALTGTDWREKVPQIRKEREILISLGLPYEPPAKAGTGTAPSSEGAGTGQGDGSAGGPGENATSQEASHALSE